MAYGILKCDTVTFTDGGVDKSVSISGLVQNPTFSGNITVTGTVSGNTIQGQTVSGVTVTGTTALFSTGTFISLTGTTSQGTTATYTSGSFTSLTGVTTSGTTANFVSGVFSTQISGATVTGNAGAFTTLTGGVTTITSGVFAAGSATNPSISFSSDTNTGIYSPGADQVAISTGGSGRLFVDASGRVGVGSAPSVGNGIHATINANNYETALVLQNANVNGWAAEMQFLGITTTDTQAKIGALATGPGSNSGALAFYTANAGSYLERLRITSAGLVGIGTSSPSYLLDVSDEARIVTRLRIDGASSGDKLKLSGITTGAIYAEIANTGNVTIIGNEQSTGGALCSGGLAYATVINAQSAYPLQLATSNTARLTVSSAGNVGIGTTTVNTTLEVLNSSTPIIRVGDGTRHVQLWGGSSTQNQAVGTATSAAFNININSSPVATFDTSGRLLVGTSSARSNFYNDTNSAFIQLESASNDGSALALVQNFNANTLGGQLILAKSNATSVGSNTLVANNDTCGRVSFQGNDGAQFVEAAAIFGAIDGTPGANDMPGRLVFSTTADGASSPTERMRITSTGQVRLAGAGITFNGDTATANELDDYEEGTWTPAITGSTTAGTVGYDNQVGKYTKIGRQVTVSCHCDTGIVTAAPTGDIRISGLPFACVSDAEFSGAAELKGIPFPTSTTSVVARGVNGQTYVEFFAYGSNATAARVQADSLATDDYINFTLTFFV